MSLRFLQVMYRYGVKTRNEVLALDGLDFEVQEGEFVAIVGRTGCGKSTAAQHMNALLNPTGGSVEIDEFINSSEKKKRSKHLGDLRKRVGLVFQFPEYQLFEETVEKDVAYGPKNFGMKEVEALQVAHECLALVGLDESFYARSPFELSGGEKRRVAIAGILALKPKYLVIDEPTAGLDPSGTRSMMDLFKSLNEKGTTIILISHDMDVVRKYAKRVIVLEKGKVVKDCSPQDLFKGDLHQYSLDLPRICDFRQHLDAQGIHFDDDAINSTEALAKAIAERGKR